MVDGECKPGLGVRRPHALLVTAGIHTEQVRDTRGCELPVETPVLGAEAGVAAADVERKERLPMREASSQGADVGMCTRLRVGLRRSEIERLLSSRIGRMEVAAPGLHH